MDQTSILIVDDRPENLLALEAALANPQYRLVRATSGEEALHLLLKADFAAIILDVRMPGLDGFETATLIKSREKSKTIPIIFISAVALEDESLAKGYDSGGIEYLRKPFNPDILRAKVKFYTDQYQKEKRSVRQSTIGCLFEQQEKARNQAELAKTQERMHFALQAAKMGVWDWDLKTGKVNWSEERERLSGLRFQEFDGQIKTAIDLLHPSDLAKATRTLISSGIENSRDIDFEFRTVWPDDTFHWLHIKGRKVFNEKGEAIRLIGTAMDITERKRLEGFLKFLVDAGLILSSSLDYQATLHKTAELMVPQFADWCVLDLIEAGSLKHYAVIHNDPKKRDRAEAFANLPADIHSSEGAGRAIRENRSILFPDPNRRNMGAELDVGVSDPRAIEIIKELGCSSFLSVPMRARHQIIGVVTLFRDSGPIYNERDSKIAEEIARIAGLAVDNARLYESAQRAIQGRDALVAAVSHDLKGPLSAIALSNELIEKKATADDSASLIKRQTTQIKNTVERMGVLITNILDVSKIEAGSLVISPKLDDMSKIVSETLEIFSPIAEKASIQIETQFDEPSLLVNVDRNSILQVVSNLLGNAVKFTQAGGKITIKGTYQGETAVFSISDTGRGIEPEQLPHVFDRFWQSSHSRRMGGAGLGLAIAKGIVEAHGGTIWCESTVGKGTIFSFTLRTGKKVPQAA